MGVEVKSLRVDQPKDCFCPDFSKTFVHLFGCPYWTNARVRKMTRRIRGTQDATDEEIGIAIRQGVQDNMNRGGRHFFKLKDE